MKKLLLIFIFIFNLIYGADEIRIRRKQVSEEANHNYCVELLQLALNNTEKEYGKIKVRVIDLELTQGRALEELSKGNYIDVDWAGTDKKREKDLLPIRIPLFGGLLGYRVLAIRKDEKWKFDKIKTIDELKKMKLVQGSQWPDSDILEAAGFDVFRTAKFDNMYSILEKSRVDFFPRSIGEAYGEVKARANKNIMVYDRIIIAYKFPMYFFVNKNNKELAERIEKGLRIAIENGSFQRFMETNPLTAPIFPLSKYKNSIIFEIDNPFLPEKTPINDKKLWIKFK